jgi:hypothetical protein
MAGKGVIALDQIDGADGPHKGLGGTGREVSFVLTVTHHDTNYSSFLCRQARNSVGIGGQL